AAIRLRRSGPGVSWRVSLGVVGKQGADAAVEAFGREGQGDLAAEVVAETAFQQAQAESAARGRLDRRSTVFPPVQLQLAAVVALARPADADATPGHRQSTVLYRVGAQFVQRHRQGDRAPRVEAGVGPLRVEALRIDGHAVGNADAHDLLDA